MLAMPTALASCTPHRYACCAVPTSHQGKQKASPTWDWQPVEAKDGPFFLIPRMLSVDDKGIAESR